MVPAMVSVDEGDGMVQVCAELSAVEATQREFSVTLATSDGSGILNMTNCNVCSSSLNICSYCWNRLHSYFHQFNFH